ncbi:hypothetical protein [Massilia niabensis]|uniref:Lipoprotein n=1 Tax=Massilia niabensis TaxID=544910 RepID=A0ABW0L4I6_9BURK
MRTTTLIRTGLTLGGLLALAGMTGCASVTTGDEQVVSVETYSPAGPVSGATCKLQNKKGFYYITTPGSLRVFRDYGDMTVTCDKPGLPTSIVRVKSKTGYTVAGNILFPIGAMVDAFSGAAYAYPALIRISMNDGVTGATATAVPGPAAAPVKGGSN